MTFSPSAVPESAARILVVDDDHRVVELLAVALGGRGYQVITAADGEEAIRQTLGQRPDLIVLDVRLPRRSGFEVCELLRRDSELNMMPIVMVSAAGEPEARLQAFARGADDYLTKPFSPRELLARIQRLLVRSRDANEARRRSRDLERELHRAQDEARRAQADTRREQRLRELAFGAGGEIHRTLDPDVAAARLLDAARDRLGLDPAMLLLRDATGARLVPHRGGRRAAGGPELELDASGELATLLHGLGRPVARRALERFPEVASEMPPVIAAGMLLLAPLVGREGLEGVLLAEGREGGVELDREDAELLGGLCELAAVALADGRRMRRALEAALDLVAGGAGEGASLERREAAAALVDRVAETTGMAARARCVVRHAVAIGRWGVQPAGFRALERLADDDPTGIAAEVRRLLDRAERIPEPDPEGDPEFERAAALAFVGMRWAEERDAGLEAGAALDVSCDAAPGLLDAATRRALREACRTPFPLAGVR